MLDQNSTNQSIKVSGAREHNLKNINLEIPKNQLVVFTGMSGSGKSSLAFDTLYAEGQRRYVESLSSYARQFLGVMHKPDVDQIDGLSPAISIDQKTTSHNPRSTVGTITEIYDYLRLLYAKIGHPSCPNCHREISSQSIDQIVNQVLDKARDSRDQNVRIVVLSPIVKGRKGEFNSLFDTLLGKGYSKVRIDQEYYDLREDVTLIKTNKHDIDLVVDRISFLKSELGSEEKFKSTKTRLVASIESALKEANGFVIASFVKDEGFDFPDKPKQSEDVLFSENFACSFCSISLSELEPRLFSFNSPMGACENCNGLGTLLKIDEKLVLAESLTLSEGAIIPFARMMGSDTWWARLVRVVTEDLGYDFRLTPLEQMTDEAIKTLLYGSTKIYQVSGTNRFGRPTMIEEKFEGFITNLERRYGETDSDFIRKEIEQFMVKQTCPTCLGARLKKDALAVHISDLNIYELTSLPIDQALAFIKSLKNSPKVSDKEKKIADLIIKEINSRLEFLSAVGLDYLTLGREASTLAGGEAQRIRLASQIGTGLTGVLYILDEPTIGLHQRDNHRLIATLKSLRDKGNSVIVVEHDRDIMNESDYIFDFGPKAGEKGGEIVAQGSVSQIKDNPNSLTGKYLSRKKDVKIITQAPQSLVDDTQAGEKKQKIRVFGAKKHNLKNIDVDFALNQLTVITGVSGSGKSTLLHDTLYYNLAKNLGRKVDQIPGDVDSIVIPDKVRNVVLIDQSPIGKTPRSNPATYIKVFDYIRKIYENTNESRIRGYKQGRFSFNVKGGRCETCQGDGQIKIEMQFLPDVYVTCDVCHGQRYNSETLEVEYKGLNISQVLDLSVNEAYDFFATHSTIRAKLKTMIDVGLGYIRLGQSAPTLSGGEAQRVKLAKELSGRTNEHVVYLLDEPTTGLHFADVDKLLQVLHQLVANNNTVILIEHNLDIIKNADHIIDLGPLGGEKGGEIIAQGSVSQLMNNTDSFTGQYLKKELSEMKKL